MVVPAAVVPVAEVAVAVVPVAVVPWMNRLVVVPKFVVAEPLATWESAVGVKE